ncbi:MAG: hypothetical protein JRM72_04110 [Nitrososphaerota archaeon]|nr:hypothetical protein [Nitrososphaerota archaeon]
MKIAQACAKRWGIEAFCRDSKEELGLDEYGIRKGRGIKRHLIMVLLAHVILVFGSRDSASVSEAGAVTDTMGSSAALCAGKSSHPSSGQCPRSLKW